MSPEFKKAYLTFLPCPEMVYAPRDRGQATSQLGIPSNLTVISQAWCSKFICASHTNLEPQLAFVRSYAQLISLLNTLQARVLPAWQNFSQSFSPELDTRVLSTEFSPT